MKAATGVIRAVQLVFAVVVLGLSINLAKDQVYGGVPAQTGYAAFTGGLGVLAALIGIAAMFVESLGGVITWAVDGLAALAFLAGGIAYAHALRGTNCSEKDTLGNKLLLGGCVKIQGKVSCGFNNFNELRTRCRSATADAAFMFLGFIITLVAVAFTFFKSRR